MCVRTTSIEMRKALPCFVDGGECAYEHHHMLSDEVENNIQDQIVLTALVNIV